MSDAADLHLLTGAYAVDALDDAERAAFEAHLAGCETCSREVVELQATAARLGAAESAGLPPSLRARVLAATADLPQERAVTGQAEVVALRRRPLTSVLAVAAAVLAVLTLALGAWATSLHRTNQELAARASDVTAVLTAADAASTTGAVSTGGRATVVVSPSLGRAVFVGSALAQPGSGRTYQLWWIDPAGAARSAGTFTPGSDGSAVSALIGTPAGASTVGVTVEPSGGSTAPTTTPVLAVPVTT